MLIDVFDHVIGGMRAFLYFGCGTRALRQIKHAIHLWCISGIGGGLTEISFCHAFELSSGLYAD